VFGQTAGLAGRCLRVGAIFDTMFVGHYSAAFAAKAVDRSIPLWQLFIAAQLVDVGWATLVLLGVEKVRIVPGITRSSPLDLYYMPYTHSLVAAVAWSVGAALLYRVVRGPTAGPRPMVVVGAAVLSHWILDWVVHRPDLALYDDAVKVGLGLWNRPLLAFLLEAGLLLGAAGFCLHTGPSPGGGRGVWVLTAVLVAVQVMFLLGPPPPSVAAVAVTALVAYCAFAWGAARVDQVV
jgi:hypothetical protein